jgi:hypothetical protein
MRHLYTDPRTDEAPTRDSKEHSSTLPGANETKIHPTRPDGENASPLFVGTTTTIL